LGPKLKAYFYAFRLFSIIMVQAVVSFKSGGVAFILAFFFGLVFFNGVGHMFIGKVRRGVGLMILGWFINSLAFVFLLNSFISLPFMQYYNSYNSNNQYNFNNDPFFPQSNDDNNDPSQSFSHFALFGLVYFLYLLIQAADANRLAKKFNQHLDKTGELLWY
jgi:TM2 domain-containing membrane protein YozV